jgi:signal peptidase I
VLRWTEHGLALVGACFLVFNLCFDLCVVTSESMKPALLGTSRENGDVVLTEKVSLWLRRPRRWEVVALALEDDRPALKRVVGLPGEKVSLRDGEVCIDGDPESRPPSLSDITYFAFGNLFRGKEAECGDGYFVMGDDSRDSEDSRFEGPFARDRIHSRAWLIVWPPGRIGRVNP